MQQETPKSKSQQPIDTETMKQFTLDYVVNEIPFGALCEKYHLTDGMCVRLIDFLKLKKKKEEYRQKVLEKALAKIVNKRSLVLVKSVNILLKQLDHIERVQDYMSSLPEDENKHLESKLSKLLPTDIVGDVMKIFMLMVKDGGIKGGEGSDSNVVAKVIVEMAPSPHGAIFQKPSPPPIDVTPEKPTSAPQQLTNGELKKAEKEAVKVEVQVDAPVLGLPT